MTMDPATLRDRLRGIVKGPGSAGSAEPIETPVTSQALKREALDTLSGSWRVGEGGRSFVITRRFGPHEPYGIHRIEDFARTLARASDAASLVGPAAATPPFVFFDLETTGLSSGAGTLAFLVGCGWFDDEGGFVTEQHLLVDYAREKPMLHVVSAALDRAGALLTFNGKSFDAPVLETRYLFHRLVSPCGSLPQVDLLHPARRFWSGGGADCSLTALEEKILRAPRVGDVPGFEIPARYFHFVRSGQVEPLVAVLEHNRFDLLSLAGITARMFHLVQVGPCEARHAREALALGHVYKAAGLDDRAEMAFERALSMWESNRPAVASRSIGPVDDMIAIKADALRALAIKARRQRRYDVAAERWRALLDLPGCPQLARREATEALAIHHEHRARDFAVARSFALKGLEFEGKAWGDAIRHRLARIERKIISDRRPLFAFLTSQPSDGSPTSAPQTSS